jgi:tryptophan halogenase
MMGQGLMPESYHPIVDNMSKQELTHFLNVIRQQVQTGLSKMLPHEAFVERYMEIRTR